MRFLDNFSAGTRGATSAEYFLKAGYAVIFLHRTHSLRPFSRHYSHSLNPFLDLLEIASSSSPNATDGSEIRVQSEQALKLMPVLRAYNRAHEEGELLGIEFQTVNDYLWLLRNVGQEMQPLQRRGMFYLAAAVSDFFLPEDRVVSFFSPAEDDFESKLTPGRAQDPEQEGLALARDGPGAKGAQTARAGVDAGGLHRVVQGERAALRVRCQADVQLETDQNLLVPKAKAALSRYGHQLVIGNELHKRKHEVVFIERVTRAKSLGNPTIMGAETPPLRSTHPSSAALSALSTADAATATGAASGEPGPAQEREEFRETWLYLDKLAKGRTPGPDEFEPEIEEYIIAELVRRHQDWVNDAGPLKSKLLDLAKSQ